MKTRELTGASRRPSEGKSMAVATSKFHDPDAQGIKERLQRGMSFHIQKRYQYADHHGIYMVSNTA